MKIFHYNSLTKLMEAYENNTKTSGLLDCGVSVSFRIYDSVGNTLELHIFYK